LDGVKKKTGMKENRELRPAREMDSEKRSLLDRWFSAPHAFANVVTGSH
jgi:hypothetical protein